MPNYSKLGFTLIELLVVIVIIGILATIAIPQFGGYFNKARNAETTFTVGIYKRVLQTYLATEGDYPPFSGTICLGGDYIASGTFLEDQCADDGAFPRFIDPNFNAVLEPLIGNLPTPNINQVVGWSGDLFRGVWITRNLSGTLDGQPLHYWINYHLEGENQDCEFVVMDQVSYPNFASTTNINTFDNAGGYGNTYCRVPLPQP